MVGVLARRIERLIRLASFKKYRNNKDGKLYWEFRAYLGVDEMTGKDVKVSRRRGEDGSLFRTKRQAEYEVTRLEAEFNKTKRKKKKLTSKETFKEVASEWIERRYRGTVRESTYLNTSEVFFKLHIIPAIGEYQIRKINKSILENVVEEWSKSFIKQRYNLMVNYTKKVFQYALEEGHISDNPFNVTHIPRAQEAKKEGPDFYDKHELKVFLEASKGYGKNGKFWNTFLHFLAFTGLRSGEVRALEWDDINFEKELVSVNKTLSVRQSEENNKTEMYLSDMTKNGEDRLVVLDEITLNKLENLREQQPKETKLVFPALRGELNQWMHAQSANNAMRKIAENNNLKRIKVHELRHTHCSLLFDAGVGVKEVQERLGHKDITITLNVYTHVTKGRKNNVADKLMEYVRNV